MWMMDSFFDVVGRKDWRMNRLGMGSFRARENSCLTERKKRDLTTAVRIDLFSDDDDLERTLHIV